MQTQTVQVGLPLTSNTFFFKDASLTYFLPEVRCISALTEFPLENDEGAFYYESLFGSRSSESHCYGFSVYLTLGLDIQFGFLTRDEAISARKDLIDRLIAFAGSNQVIYADGIDFDVFPVYGIDDITDIFEKDSHHCFSISLQDVPYPVDFVIKDGKGAAIRRTSIMREVERYRQEKSMNICAEAVC